MTPTAEHLERSVLDRFRRGELTASENRRVVRHLLSGCAECRGITASWWPRDAGSGLRGSAEASSSKSYDAAFERATHRLGERQRFFSAERAQAASLLAELEAIAPELQSARVGEEQRFQSWTLTEALLDRCHEIGFSDPGQALRLAELGVLVAERLSPRVYGEAQVRDLEARAQGCLANALRINSRFRQADETFQRARTLLARGTGDPLEQARLHILEASLRGDQRRFAEAQRLFDRGISVYRRTSEHQLLGRALISKGLFLGYAGDLEGAIVSLRQGIELVDSRQEPRLRLAGVHNLILYLADSGRPREALELLDETRPLYREIEGRMNLVRLRWVEGRIAHALGHTEQAEQVFREVREEFVSRGLGCDAALVSLDLATVYAELSKPDAMRRLAAEMLPIFRSQDVHREAIAALIVFQRAAEMEQVSVSLLKQIGRYLERSRHNPQLRFQPTD